MHEQLNVIALVRDTRSDTFVFLYDNESTSELYDQIQVLAADKELNLTFQDVVTVRRKIKELESLNQGGVLDFE